MNIYERVNTFHFTTSRQQIRSQASLPLPQMEHRQTRKSLRFGDAHRHWSAFGAKNTSCWEQALDFSAWFEGCLAGRWYPFDARHNSPRIDRILIA
jgi:hypothetical protein